MKNCMVLIFSFCCLWACGKRQPPQQAQEPAKPPTVSALVAYDGIGIRHQPTDDKSVKGNVFTVVDRGVKVTVLADSTSWTKVKLADDKEGWIRTNLIRVGDIKLAVLTDEIQVLLLPDPSSRAFQLDSASGKLGSIVWIYKTKDGYYECEFPKVKKGWVKIGNLSEDASEIEAAKLLEQARKYAKNGDADLSQKFYQQIADKYPTTKVAQIIVLESDVSIQSTTGE